jgi:ribosome modulation factor
MVQFYKPNAKNLGNAFGFRMGVQGKSEEPCVYMTAIKQHSWNEKTRNGSFAENAKNPEKSISLKFNEMELGGFIYAIENYDSFKAYHTYEDNSTAISLNPYTKKNGEKAFSFTVTRNSANKFGIGLELSEAYLLVQFFKFVLNKLFVYRVDSFKQNSQ